MLRRITALAVSVLIVWSSTPSGIAQTKAAPNAPQLIERSYLDLLEMQSFPKLSNDQIKAIEDQLENEKKAEQERLKREENRLEDQVKEARRRLDQLNVRSSRDTDQMTAQRAELHCRVLQLESEAKKIETERQKGVPVMYQNKFAKLELVQKWPAIHDEIERQIEAGNARSRRFGNVEDIGVRDLGIDDLGDKQTDDIKIGQEVIREMKTQGVMPPVVEDKELTDYMQKLGEKIAANSDLRVPIKVTVLDSKEINAFALPGGFLFINTGLINKAESETELVGVMAHEIAHAAARHGPRLMKRASIANMLFQAAQVGAMIFTGGAVGVGTYYALQYGFYGLGMIIDLSLLGVSRDFESEADQLGAQYAWKAGYDPKGFITFFDKMASEEGFVKSASFFRTHPAFLERIISTFSEIKYLPPKKDLRLTSSAFSDAKERVKSVITAREQEDKNAPTLKGKGPDCAKILGRPISN